MLLPWVAVFMWLDGFAPLLEVAFCLFCALLQLHCAAVVRLGVFKFAAASERFCCCQGDAVACGFVLVLLLVWFWF